MRTTSSWWLLNMAEYFRRKKLPVQSLFEEAGLSFQSLMFANTRYPQDGVTKLWQLVERRTQNKEIGFYVGRDLNVSGMPVLGQSLIAASNLKDGFDRFFRYQRLLGEAASIKFIEKEDEVHLRFNFTGDEKPICQHTYDVAMAATVSMIRVLAGEDWEPKAVNLSRSKPKAIHDFNAFFNCPLEFDASIDKIVMFASDFESVSTPLPSFDTNLSTVEAAESKQPLSSLLSMYLSQQLQNSSLDRTKAARALNMSPRSLQRKLESEGSGYQEVLNKVRREKALEYLSVPKMSLTAIAFLCGFSDATAFNRAFRRWFNQSPGNYRKTHVSAR